jgi:hypothetical protein
MGITDLQEIYVLHHVHELENGYEDVKLLGIFSSEAKALKLIERYKLLEGFKDYPGGFSVDKYTVDKSHWNEGFTTVE